MRRLAVPVVFALIAVLALAVFAACGGGGGGDEAQIRKLVRDTASALEDMDGKKMASLMSKECDVSAEEMEAVFVLLRAFSGDDKIEVTIDEIEVTDLTDNSANVRVQGSVKVMGQEEPFSDGQTSRAVKEDGKWRWADCEGFVTE